MSGVLLPLLGTLGVTIPEGNLEVGRKGSAPKSLLLALDDCVLKGSIEQLDGLLVGFGDQQTGAEFLHPLVFFVGGTGLPKEGVGKTDLTGGESGLDGVVSVSHFFDLFLSLLSLLCIYKKAFRRYSTGKAQVI